MPAIALGRNAYKRDSGHAAEIRLVNRYFEADPGNAVDQVALMPRPAIVPFADAVGLGPVRAVFQRSGVLGGDILVVSGTELYRVTSAGVATLVGTVTGSDLVEIDSDGTNTFIAAGTLYLYNGTTLTTVSTPDSVQIISVAQFNSYFLLQVEGSGRFYWIEPGATTIDALNFATAERAPDAGVAIRIIGDFIVLLNAQWTEFWTATGDSAAPFQRQSGLLFEKGCTERATAVNLDNSLFWVSETATEGRAVYRSGQGVPQRVSVTGIEERMRSGASLSAFAFVFDGHAFYALRIDGVGTFMFDVSTGTWSEWASYGRDNWRVQCAGAAPGGQLLLGDDETGQLWTLDPAVGNDNGEPIQRIAMGRIPALQRASIGNISITTSVGWVSDLVLEPVMSMRLARDGFTWTNPKERSLGRRGQFGKRVRWERCGEIRPPFLLIEFADSDDAQTRISFARYDEAG